MKIAFLHMTMGLVNRGSEVVIDMVAQALAKKHQVIMIQSGPITPKSYKVIRTYPQSSPPNPAPTSIWDKIRFRLHLDDNSGKVAEFTRSSLSHLHTFKPDLIVAVNGSLQLRILQGLALQAKLVAFGHAGIGHDDRAVLHRSPDLFVALTREAEVWAKRYQTTRTKIVQIPNPIDLSLYQKAKPLPLSLTRPIVLTVGALSQYKNVRNVVQAIKQTQASLILIGDGEQAGELSKDFSTLANSFFWIKNLEPNEMPSHYQAADVFCFTPDPQEAFGRVYLEAMASGLPIVASDDPIRRQIIGDFGIYVDPHDPVKIASGIKQALRLGKLNYDQQLKQYRLATVVSQLEKEFHALIS